MKHHANLRQLSQFAASLLAAMSYASAQTTVNWEGDVSNLWATGGNWDIAPTSSLTANIANFNLSSYGGLIFAPTVGTATSIAGITIGASNGAMTLTTGGLLTIGGSGISIASGAGAFTISGSTTLGAAQSWLNNSANLFTFGAVTNGGFLLTIGGSGNATASGIISGSGGLTKSGAGSLTLTGANDYTGATTISRGILMLSGASGAITGSNVNVRGGTLVLDNSTAWADRLGAATTLSLGSMTLTSYDGAGDRTESTGATTFATSGKVTINNGNTAGDRTTLALGAVTRSVGAAIDFVGTGGTLGGAGDTPKVTSTGAFPGAVNGILPWATVGGAQWAENNSGSIRAYSGSFNTDLTTATNIQNAQTTGTLALAAPAVANSLNLITSGAGQSLSLGSNNLTLGSATGSAAAILKSGVDTYTISGTGQVRAGSAGAGTELIAHVDGGDLTISAPLATAIVGIAKGGTGKLILSGTRAATFSNGIGITGTLELQGSTTALSGVVSGTGGLTANLTSGQTLTLSNTNTYSGGFTLTSGTVSGIGSGTYNGFGTGTFTASNGTLSFNGGSTQTIFNELSWGGGNLVLTRSAGTTPNTTWTGPLTLTGNQTLTLGASTTSNNSTFTGDISGDFGLVIAGPTAGASLTLSGANNTFSGGLIMNSSNVALNINSGTALGTGTFTITATGAINNTSGGATTLANNNALAINSNFTFTGTNDLNMGTGAVNLGAGTRSITTTAGTLTLGGAISNGGITKLGAGTLVLSGTSSNTYGTITTVSAGTLELNKTTNATRAIAAGGVTVVGSTVRYAATAGDDQINDAASVTLANGAGVATLNLNGINDTIGSLTIGGASGTTTSQGVVTTGAGTLTLGGNVTYTSTGNSTVTSTINGNLALGTAARTFTIGDSTGTTTELDVQAAISGTDVGLTKTGTGTMKLSGANTYNGSTTLTQGILSLDFTNGNNRINSGNALVGNGGTLEFANLGTNTQTLGATTLNAAGAASFITRSGTYTSGVSDLGTLSGYGVLDVSSLTSSPSWIKASGNMSQTYLLNGLVTANGGTGLVSTDASGNLLSVASTNYANNAIIASSPASIIRLVTGGSTGSGPNGSGFFGLSTSGTTDLDSLLNAYTTGTSTIDVTNSGTNPSNILRMGSVGVINSNSGAALTIGTTVANGGTLTAGGGDNTAGALYVNANNAVTINSVITNNGSGVVGLNKAGSGTLTLAAANTYTGGTALNSGTLLATTNSTSLTLAASNLNPLGSGAVNLNGGILQLRASGTVNTTAETIQLNNNVTVGGDATINIDRPGVTSTTKTIQLGTLNMGANTLGVTGANNYALRFNGATTLTGNATFNVANIYNNNPSLTLAGAVGDGSAGYSLTKTGAGILTLSGTNTFSGGVFINAGTLSVASAANLGDSANVVTFTGNGTISLPNITLSQGFAINAGVTGTLAASNATVTINNSLAGSGTLFVAGGSTGGGNFTFTSTNNPFSGNIRIYNSSGGTYPAALTLNSLADSPGSRITLGNGSSWVSFNYGAGADVPLVLNNRQIEYWGDNRSPSYLNNNAALATSTVTVNTDLIVNGTTPSFGLGGSNTGNNTFAGAIGNSTGSATSLTKANAGNWILSNTNNSYTGTTTINGGTLSVSKMAHYGTNSPIGKGTAGTAIAFGGGALNYTGTGDDTNRLIQVSAGNGTILNNGTDVLNFTETGNFNVQGSTTTARTFSLGGTNGGTISGAIQNNTNTGSALSLTKIGTGTWTLAGTNTYNGNTDVNAGTLRLQSGAITITQTLGGLRNQLADGTLNSNKSGDGDITTTFGSYLRSAGATGNIVSTGGTNGTDNSVNITGTAGFIDRGLFFGGSEYAARNATNGYLRALAYGSDPSAVAVDTITGSSHVKLTSSPASQGNTSLSSLNLQGGGVSWTSNTGTTLTTPGILKSGGGGQSTISGGNLTTPSNSELVIRTDISSDSLLISSNLNHGGGVLTKSGDGLLTLSGTSSTFTGQTHVNAGTLSISSNANLGAQTTGATLNLKGGTLQATGTFGLFNGTAGTNNRAVTLLDQSGIEVTDSNTLTIAGVMSNNTNAGVTTPGFNKIGTGTLLLTGTNTYTGLTSVDAGTLSLGHATDTLAATSSVRVNGGTLALGANSDTVGAVTLTSGSITGSGGTLTGSSYAVESGSISAILGGSGALTKSSAGTVTLTGGNSYTGGTILAAGRLSFANGSLGSTGNITFTGNSTLQWNGANTQDISGRIVMGNGVTSIFDTNGNDVSFAAALGNSGSGALTKLGAGTLTLTGTSTYGGVTTVSGGMLAITGTGSINSSSGISVASGAHFKYNSTTALTAPLTLSSGSTLSGSGTIGVDLALTSTSQILAPGNSPGIQTLATTQNWSSFTYEWETNDFLATTAGTDFDQIAITGDLNLTGMTEGSYILDITSLTSGNLAGDVPNFTETNRSWDILTATGEITGFNAAYWTLNTDGFTSNPAWQGTWSLGLNGSNDALVLSYTVIPEPKAALLGGLGILLLFRRRR